MQTDMERLLKQNNPSRRELLGLVVALSMPTIVAELSGIGMKYIDAAMVGSLGANASGAVGLVASSTWLVDGLCMAAATGFTVQIAQLVGAGKHAAARNVLRQAFVVLGVFSLLLAAAASMASGPLPGWLGGDAEIWNDASAYFLICALALPAVQVIRLCTGALQCSGDMRTPSRLNVLMCLLDVVFNFFLIFPTRTVVLPLVGLALTIPGAGLGVAGAALGTVAAEAVVAILLVRATVVASPVLGLGRGRDGGVEPVTGLPVSANAGPAPSWHLTRHCLKTALRVAAPLCLERTVMSAAQITSVAIVAPLGTVAVAAHSLAITAEGLCYMPGYGIGAAATTLVGQSIGAGRQELARRLGTFVTLFGMVVMTCTGALMFVLAPAVMALFTPDVSVQQLGVEVLRIELFAEPFFAASIVAMGAMRGAGDTLAPSLMNLGSMWVVRIPAATLMAARFGLHGVWVAMTVELVFRGVVFLVRLRHGRWLNCESMA